jgi:hypothetical protein
MAEDRSHTHAELSVLGSFRWRLMADDMHLDLQSHRTSAAKRCEARDVLQLRAGDRVLDLGCGRGDGSLNLPYAAFFHDHLLHIAALSTPARTNTDAGGAVAPAAGSFLL